jgi:pimeloyl-ACP methyl ester carboxylesterase
MRDPRGPHPRNKGIFAGNGTVVIYVHGLWLNGWESILLRRRLASHLDCHAVSFSYSSVNGGLTQNVQALASFLEGLRADTLHLVGHSMGGLLILELFETARAFPPGRIVLLGSPVQGSQAARKLTQWPFGRRIMGLTAHDTLLSERARRWSGARDLGVIAGNLALGFGRLVGPFGEPSDGTVLVSETRLDGARQHLTLRTTHSGMLYSRPVARQVGMFLREGHFVAE